MANPNPGTRIVPKIIFPVGDMTAASEFYRALGFEVESYDGGYAWVKHRNEELLLGMQLGWPATSRLRN